MTELLTSIDAEDVANVPETGWDLLLAYINGAVTSQNYAQMRARFPSATIKTISVTGTDQEALAADIFDCELGDYTEATVAEACSEKITQKLGRPCPYFSAALYDDVAVALEPYGLEFERDVDCLIADYDGIADLTVLYNGQRVVRPGTVGKQYAGYPNGGSPGDYDMSVLLASWVTPGPVPTSSTPGSCPVLSTVFSAPRPASLGGGNDEFYFDTSGALHWMGDVPDWEPGASEVIPTIAAVGGLAWWRDDASALVLQVLSLDPGGQSATLRENTIVPWPKASPWVAGEWGVIATDVKLPS